MDRDIILLHRHFFADHLEAVKSEMLVLGAPTIRAVWNEGLGVWIALEGCHRLRACVELGIEPVVKEVEFTPESMVIEDLGLKLEDEMTLEELIDQIMRFRFVTFNDLLAVKAA